MEIDLESHSNGDALLSRTVLFLGLGLVSERAIIKAPANLRWTGESTLTIPTPECWVSVVVRIPNGSRWLSIVVSIVSRKKLAMRLHIFFCQLYGDRLALWNWATRELKTTWAHKGVLSPEENALASGEISRTGRSWDRLGPFEVFEVVITGTRGFRCRAFLEGGMLDWI